jgi:hypothetical protein
MSERKPAKRAPRTRGKKQGERSGGAERKPADPAALDVTWDQPQPRYPAPERPRDRAEERKRSA